MALSQSIGVSQRQSQRQYLSPKMMIWAGLLAKPVGELWEAVKQEIATNPAIDDVDVSPFFRRGGVVSSEIAAAAMDKLVAKGVSLDEHLLSELRLAGVDGKLHGLAELIIGELDENGRFTGSMPDLVMVSGATTDALEKARKFVMTLDPLGCGAKDAEECLLAQLPRVPAADRVACRKVIERFADLKAGKLSIDDVGAESLAVFRKYRGKFEINPGERFAPKRTDVIVPDIEVDGNGDFSVETGDIPEIRVSTKYLQMSKDRSLDEETRKYAQERVRHAIDFAAAIRDRQETMERIAETVFEAQKDFLRDGKASLKPLTMTEVARQAKCSVATVSRAASRKYAKTPRGTLPLRSFFSVIDQEPIAKLKVMLEKYGEGRSDREISEMMAKIGVKLARRTVNKYRMRFSGK